MYFGRSTTVSVVRNRPCSNTMRWPGDSLANAYALNTFLSSFVWVGTSIFTENSLATALISPDKGNDSRIVSNWVSTDSSRDIETIYMNQSGTDFDQWGRWGFWRLPIQITQWRTWVGRNSSESSHRSVSNAGNQSTFLLLLSFQQGQFILPMPTVNIKPLFGLGTAVTVAVIVDVIAMGMGEWDEFRTTPYLITYTKTSNQIFARKTLRNCSLRLSQSDSAFVVLVN